MTDSIGNLSVEREESSVLIKITEDGEESTYYLSPHQAVGVGMWLQQAAADAKRYHEGSHEQ